MNAEQRKLQGTQFLKELKIYEDYRKEFENNSTVTMFERYVGYWAWQYPELQAKIKEIETQYNCTVYAITHEYFEFGECYSFLIVTKYKQEWKHLLEKDSDGTFYVYAYVWNKDMDYCSEFGTIGIKSAFGGIRRYA